MALWTCGDTCSENGSENKGKKSTQILDSLHLSGENILSPTSQHLALRDPLTFMASPQKNECSFSAIISSNYWAMVARNGIRRSSKTRQSQWRCNMDFQAKEVQSFLAIVTVFQNALCHNYWLSQCRHYKDLWLPWDKDKIVTKSDKSQNPIRLQYKDRALGIGKTVTNTISHRIR